MAQDTLHYTNGGLDRAALLRKDPAWIAARLVDPSSRFLPVWRNRNLVVDEEPPRPVALHGPAATMALELAEEVIFLGLQSGPEGQGSGKPGRAIFALDISALSEEDIPAVTGGTGRFAELRDVGPRMDQGDGQLLAYARGIVYWHGRHRFCGRCGGPAESADGGHVRRCASSACGGVDFPRTDPAVIMLVHDGGERCLLGRNPRFPPGMHSTLAGFVEPGESLEEAVAREVAEEVGLGVVLPSVRYYASQPWPFPASLMLGFHARAEPGTLKIEEQELESARWFHRRELADSPEDDRFRLPRGDSIARRLIQAWLKDRS